MKNFLNILILIPLLIYILLLLVNKDILTLDTQINVFWIYKWKIQIILYITFFFISYLLILWSLFKFSNFFADHKNKKQNEQINELKAKLADQTPELISKIQNILDQNLKQFKEEADKKLELTKKETQKVLWNLEYEISILKEKIDKLSKT